MGIIAKVMNNTAKLDRSETDEGVLVLSPRITYRIRKFRVHRFSVFIKEASRTLKL